MSGHKNGAAPQPRAPGPRTADEQEAWLMDWKIAVARPLLPTGFPVAAGWPADDAYCGCCRNRGWARVGEWWVCATCHPPSRGEEVRR